MPDNYRFDAGASLSVRELGDGWVEVSCALDQSERFVAQLSASAGDGVFRLRASFTRTQLDKAVGSRHLAGRLLSRLLGHGLVHAATPGMPHAGDAALALGLTEGAIPLAYHEGAVDGVAMGFGVSTTARLAGAGARGEAWERRALLRPDLALPEAQMPRLPSGADTPGLLFDFLRQAAPLSPARYPAITNRVSRRIGTGSAVGLLPGQWIYPGASPASNSNGVASGTTLAQALTGARLELIERDALLRAWYGVVASRPLESGELAHPSLRRLAAKASAAGLHSRWFVLGTGPAITVACMVNGIRRPHLGLGSATRSTLPEAAGKAFLEAAGSHLGHVMAHRHLGARGFARRAARLTARPPEDVHRRDFETFWAAQAADAAREIARRFSQRRARTRHRLREAGFRWLDLTSRDASRRRVVKVFHPDAAPLPNTMAQVHLLEALLGVRSDGTPPPIS